MAISIYAFDIIFKEFWLRWLCKTEITLSCIVLIHTFIPIAAVKVFRYLVA